MRKLTRRETVDILGRGIPGYLAGFPTVVSFEMTYSCPANCRHCDMGGMVEEEKLIGPNDYRRLMRTLKPVIVQISGGEPLLREDLTEIMTAIKPRGKHVPYLIVVSNGWLLTREKYLALREAGMNQLSLSLCFPDSRHDEWRRLKGLYDHLDRLVPELASLGHDDIVLNSAITHENMPHIMDLVHNAARWGVSISFSAYSILRTGERKYTIEKPEDLEVLRQQLDALKEYKASNCGSILNADFNIDGTYDFFKYQEIKPCSAGQRFLVVTPGGYLKPCSMHEKNYTSLRQIRREFVPNNDCGGCYVSIRSYLDKSLPGLLKEYLKAHSFRNGKNKRIRSVA
ncbi:MAG: radical SAM protein [Candidatus Glassbacteria bacterium]|nr:radical SAM protein [Candidatus Glassbacteria bacterium]